jgi:DNA-directed RNA polymerase specialized sigma subunit
MTHAERDRLVVPEEGEEETDHQKQAAEELGITQRHVRRLLREAKHQTGGPAQ